METSSVKAFAFRSFNPTLNSGARDAKLTGDFSDRVTTPNHSHHFAPTFFIITFLLILIRLQYQFSIILLAWRCLHLGGMEVLAPVRSTMNDEGAERKSSAPLT
jgi:hypothetical protein